MATHPYTRLFAVASDPTVNDDITLGYEIGDHWITATGVFVCLDNTDGAAVWQDTVGGGGFTQEEIEDFIGAMVTGNTETGIAVTYDDGTAKLNFVAEVTQAELDAKTTGHVILDDGTPMTQRSGLSFAGNGLTISDDLANDWTLINFAKHGIKDEGSSMTSRTNLNFIGTGVTLTDDSGANETEINIPGREVLTANRTYYVRTDGSDSNNGLANTSGGAFLTIQKAVDVVAALDIRDYDVTIQVGNGTYTGGVIFSGPWVGAGDVTIQGDTTTPTNVVISTTSTGCFLANGNVKVLVQGFKLQTTTAGNCIQTNSPGAIIAYAFINFGACAGDHVRSDSGLISCNSNYTISGGAGRHFLVAIQAAVIAIAGLTVTVSGTPAFSQFALAQAGMISDFGTTFSGAATGTRYSVSLNGVINTFGAGANHYPGNVAGATATGGQYG